MPIGLIITGIISAIGAIVGAVVDAGKAALDVIMQFFQAVFSLLQSFVQSAPTPMKVVIFLFFVLTIGNVFSSFLISTRYACNGNNVLYETSSIGTAMTLMLKTQFQDLSVGDRNTYISNNFQMSNRASSPTHIKCVSTSPKLFFYSVDILDYKMWLLILFLLFGAPMIWNYYSRMGVLN
jgi:hypothetical protein